jgi:adenylate cyclase, class 2
MTYEVEKKFPVNDLQSLEATLLGMGASPFIEEVEFDVYFQHPSRDFIQTDEAIRIRRVGEHVCVTYKGPRIDRTTKTRREIELPLGMGPDVDGSWQELFIALGFTPVEPIVRKTRRLSTLVWEGRELTLALDDVEGLGTFIEIELVVEEPELEAAKSLVGSLADHLGLKDSETRSYLCMLCDTEKGGGHVGASLL